MLREAPYLKHSNGLVLPLLESRYELATIIEESLCRLENNRPVIKDNPYNTFSNTEPY